MELGREKAITVALSCRGIVAGYEGKAILHAVDVDVARSSVAALVGPNGSGKTTLLRVLTGLMKPESGRVLLAGSDLVATAGNLRARQIAFVPQTVQLVMPYTVYEIAALGRLPHMHPWQRMTTADRQAVEDAIEATELTCLRDASYVKLSAGEQQRALLSLALAQQPEVLILDEPTAHLDVKHAWSLMETIARLARDRSLTVLFSTHDLQVAASFANHVVLLREGRVVGSGAPEKTLTSEKLSTLYDHPIATLSSDEATFIAPRRRP